MKKRVEHEELLADLLAENDGYRAATLERSLAILRRVRARRRAARLAVGTALPLLVLAAILSSQHWNDDTGPVANMAGTAPMPSAPAVKTIEGTPIRLLSDEELLAVFKDRPVALIGEPGHQRLVLLDEVIQ